MMTSSASQQVRASLLRTSAPVRQAVEKHRPAPLFLPTPFPSLPRTEKIRNHQGQMSVEALVAAITPDARGRSASLLSKHKEARTPALCTVSYPRHFCSPALVPDEAKRKLLERIREVLKDEPM